MNLKEVIQYLKKLETKYGNLPVYSEYDGQYDKTTKEYNFIYEGEEDSYVGEKIIKL